MFFFETVFEVANCRSVNLCFDFEIVVEVLEFELVELHETFDVVLCWSVGKKATRFHNRAEIDDWLVGVDLFDDVNVCFDVFDVGRSTDSACVADDSCVSYIVDRLKALVAVYVAVCVNLTLLGECEINFVFLNDLIDCWLLNDLIDYWLLNGLLDDGLLNGLLDCWLLNDLLDDWLLRDFVV